MKINLPFVKKRTLHKLFPLTLLMFLFCVNSVYAQPCTIGGYEPCDDGDPCTISDFWDMDCIICMGIPVIQGEPCDDGDSLTINDQYDFQCNCAGTPVCVVGTPCDDNDPNTVNDRRVSTDCTCEGTPLPCAIGSGHFARDTIQGCTKAWAPNYDPNANVDNETCNLGKIGGRIWFDRNLNGIKDATGGEWYIHHTTIYLLDANLNIIDSSDTQGGTGFLFDELPAPATYSILVDVPFDFYSFPNNQCTPTESMVQTFDWDGTLDNMTTRSLMPFDCLLDNEFGYGCQ